MPHLSLAGQGYQITKWQVWIWSGAATGECHVVNAYFNCSSGHC